MASAASRAVILVALLGVAARFCAAARNPRLKPPPGASTAKYNLVFFGDSLTDVGNDFDAAGVPDPKIYYKGRFSNGPVWPNHLETAVAKKASVQAHNYAYGGATACANAEVEAAFPFVKNLTAQVAAFAADVKSKKVKTANFKTVALQHIGSYDFQIFFQQMQETNQTISPAAVLELVANTIACRVQGAAALAAVPGVTDIVILPFFPLYIAPAAPESAKPALRGMLAAASNATFDAMNRLSANLAAAGSSVRLHLLTDTAWVGIGVRKVDPPFTYFDVPCFTNPGSPLTINAGIKVCKNPEEYAFYDQIHPSNRFHEWFATKGVLPRLQAAGALP